MKTAKKRRYCGCFICGRRIWKRQANKCHGCGRYCCGKHGHYHSGGESKTDY
jgi:hypothetical protein